MEAGRARFADPHVGRLLAGLDSHLACLYAALPVNALLVVVTGQGDTPEVRAGSCGG